MNNNIKLTEEAKAITISQLPFCGHKEKLLKIVVNPEQAEICVVAIMDSATMNGETMDGNTWSAYAGYPPVSSLDINILVGDLDVYLWHCDNIRDREQVKMMGDLLPENVARELFPNWKNKYRNEKGK